MKARRILALVAASAALGLASFFLWPHLTALLDPAGVSRLIADAGAWAPLLFIGLQVLQVLIAPIPGQVAAVAGGYLFGPIEGTLYTMIGGAIGFSLAFLLARRLGRRYVERKVPTSLLERMDLIAGRKGGMVLFIVFLLPAFPDDLIALVAGLSAVSFSTFFVASVAGRLPGYALLSATGAGLAEENMNVALVLAGLTTALLAVAWWQRDWLRRRLMAREEVPATSAPDSEGG